MHLRFHINIKYTISNYKLVSFLQNRLQQLIINVFAQRLNNFEVWKKQHKMKFLKAIQFPYTYNKLLPQIFYQNCMKVQNM
mgnify:CR=1 FL=1